MKIQTSYKHVFICIMYKVGIYSHEVVESYSAGAPCVKAPEHLLLIVHSWLYFALQCNMCLCSASILSWSRAACSSDRKPKWKDKGSLSL